MSRQESYPAIRTAAHLQSLQAARLQAELMAARNALATRKAAMYYAATTQAPRGSANGPPAPEPASAYDRYLREEARRIALQVLKARARATASSTLFMRVPNATLARDPALYGDDDEDSLLEQLPTSCFATKMDSDGDEARLPTVDFLNTPRAT